jgi:hypothetical protein
MRYLCFVIAIAILCCLFVSGCSQEAKYKNLSTLVDDDLPQKKPHQKKTVEKTDLYPGKLLIEKYQTDQLSKDASTSYIKADSFDEESDYEPSLEKILVKNRILLVMHKILRLRKEYSKLHGRPIYSLQVGGFAVKRNADVYAER